MDLGESKAPIPNGVTTIENKIKAKGRLQKLIGKINSTMSGTIKRSKRSGTTKILPGKSLSFIIASGERAYSAPPELSGSIAYLPTAVLAMIIPPPVLQTAVPWG